MAMLTTLWETEMVLLLRLVSHHSTQISAILCLNYELNMTEYGFKHDLKVLQD